MANDIEWQNMPLVMPVLFDAFTFLAANIYEEKICINLIKNIQSLFPVRVSFILVYCCCDFLNKNTIYTWCKQSAE